jgi:hypothetical protein
LLFNPTHYRKAPRARKFDPGQQCKYGPFPAFNKKLSVLA